MVGNALTVLFQEKVREAVNERERLASALANQQSVIETFEKDFTEAIGQIEFLQQRIKQLEEQAQAAQDVSEFQVFVASKQIGFSRSVS